tara:strand:+ start:242 stop:733 length:492 start_codon:yes stop_codon:yes gene_type:complete
MLKLNLKNIVINITIVLTIFLLDRFTKNYILDLVELDTSLNIYLNEYLNLYLIWNKGIAFGLFSFDQSSIYNTITIIILIITIIILAMIWKADGLKKYSLIFVFGGSLGNIFDRVYYSAVPDFIDLHINNFHWFIFNVADIFISLGVILLIITELAFDKKNND